MANWKKVIVSGSDAVLNSLTIVPSGSLLTASVSITSLPTASGASWFVAYDTASGQLTYASTASLSATTASLALSTSGSLVRGSGIQMLSVTASAPTSSFNGSTEVILAISGAAELSDMNLTAWDSGSGKFINSGLILSSSATAPTASLLNSGSVHLSIQLTGASSSLSGSFSGSFQGDGSKLTGIGGTLNLSGSVGNSGSVNLATQTLTISGSATSISASISGSTSGSVITLGFMPNVQMTNLTVTNDLIVQGTASFQNTENLLVRDRFILLASGSTQTGDGGLIVQQATQDVGELFGYDSGAQRWAVTSSYNAASGSFVPDAFMAAVVTASLSASVPNTPARYQAAGNIFIGTDDESIWIYS